jgi:hypothetical protein
LGNAIKSITRGLQYSNFPEAIETHSFTLALMLLAFCFLYLAAFNFFEQPREISNRLATGAPVNP